MKKLDKHEVAALRATRKERADSAPPSSTRACVVVPVKRGADQASAKSDDKLGINERLAESIGLTQAIGLDVRFSWIVPLNQLRPSTLIGSGKVEEIGAIIKTEGAAVVIVDHALTPVQQRNLEKAWNAKVLDRTGLILEIFGERAQSKEGRLQVELSRLTYQKSRLVRAWTHLERQRGGFGFLGGPGETQIEADRRAIGERIDSIRSELSIVERTRRLHRKRRKAARQPVISLVGYTNAGKSSLFNALSGASVFAKDMLFATLDPTLRRVKFSDGSSFILSDTVGFISELPAQLIAAFRATLEEIVEADLILHVRDIASPSSAAQAAEVEKVLAEIGIDTAHQKHRIAEVWNKADLLSDDIKTALRHRAKHNDKPSFLVSAQTGEGLPELIEFVRERFATTKHTRDITIDQGNGPLIHWLYENAEIVDRQDYHDGSLHFQVRITEERAGDLDRRLRRAL